MRAKSIEGFILLFYFILPLFLVFFFPSYFLTLFGLSFTHLVFGHTDVAHSNYARKSCTLCEGFSPASPIYVILYCLWLNHGLTRTANVAHNSFVVVDCASMKNQGERFDKLCGVGLFRRTVMLVVIRDVVTKKQSNKKLFSVIHSYRSPIVVIL